MLYKSLYFIVIVAEQSVIELTSQMDEQRVAGIQKHSNFVKKMLQNRQILSIIS
jgi:hypothetical protein